MFSCPLCPRRPPHDCQNIAISLGHPRAGAHVPLILIAPFHVTDGTLTQFVESWPHESAHAVCPNVFHALALFVLIRLIDAGDDAPSQKEISCWCVCYYKGSYRFSASNSFKGGAGFLLSFLNYTHNKERQQNEGKPSSKRHNVQTVTKFERNHTNQLKSKGLVAHVPSSCIFSHHIPLLKCHSPSAVRERLFLL